MRTMVSNLPPIGVRFTNRKLDLEDRQYVVGRRVIKFFFDDLT